MKLKHSPDRVLGGDKSISPKRSIIGSLLVTVGLTAGGLGSEII
jgi:hypothetical protein